MVSFCLSLVNTNSIFGAIKMSKDKLWVVEALNVDGWEMCNFAGLPYTTNKFLEGHKIKNNIATKLMKLKHPGWKKNMFRVVEYRRK